MRGGVKAARNGAIGCAILLAIFEGVGIGVQKMLAAQAPPQQPLVCLLTFLLMFGEILLIQVNFQLPESYGPQGTSSGTSQGTLAAA